MPGDELRYFANNYFAKLRRTGGLVNERRRVVSGSMQPGPAAPGRPSSGLGHPLRAALLDLLARRGTLTSTQAARELGESSGACSFHLRQLERYGHIEPVPDQPGRARPWRLVTARPAGQGGAGGGGDEFGELARELENEGYRRWLAGRDTAPRGWHDEAFSTVLHLTPAQVTELAEAIRGVITQYSQREHDAGQETSVLPVGVVARLFPLLPPADPEPRP